MDHRGKVVEKKIACIHNARCRYLHGYYCEDCDTFFHKDSDTYRSDELLQSIWMVLHNINVDLSRAGKEKDIEAYSRISVATIINSRLLI